jgi:hypothetical protein
MADLSLPSSTASASIKRLVLTVRLAAALSMLVIAVMVVNVFTAWGLRAVFATACWLPFVWMIALLRERTRQSGLAFAVIIALLTLALAAGVPFAGGRLEQVRPAKLLVFSVLLAVVQLGLLATAIAAYRKLEQRRSWWRWGGRIPLALAVPARVVLAVAIGFAVLAGYLLLNQGAATRAREQAESAAKQSDAESMRRAVALYEAQARYLRRTEETCKQAEALMRATETALRYDATRGADIGQRAIALARQCGDAALESEGLERLGVAATRAGQYQVGERFFDAALKVRLRPTADRQAPKLFREAMAAFQLGIEHVEATRQRPEAALLRIARLYCLQAAKLCEEAAKRPDTASSQKHLEELRADSRKMAHAARGLLALTAHELGEKQLEVQDTKAILDQATADDLASNQRADLLDSLGKLHQELGENDEAKESFRQARSLRRTDALKRRTLRHP